MYSLRDLLPALPQILTAQWSIENPTTALSTARIAGRNDDYGTVNWTPPLDNTPFAVIYWQDDKEDGVLRPNQIWTVTDMLIFLGIAPAGSAAAENYNDLAVAWRESLKLLIPKNRRLLPYSLPTRPDVGDWRWEVPRGQGGKIMTRTIDGVDFYGVEVTTTISYALAVSYQS